MSDAKPTLIWFRRDLRLEDHPALHAAIGEGGPVIPVFVRDEGTAPLGAAASWRLGEALAAFRGRLRGLGSDLILRRGDAAEIIPALVAETGAGAVHWSRTYTPAAIARDMALKKRLESDGVRATGHEGHLLLEPWALSPASGPYYRVYSPFQRALFGHGIARPLPEVTKLAPLEAWPPSDTLERWGLGAAMNRGAGVIAAHARIGAAAADARLEAFLEHKIAAYKTDRDRLDRDATSGLSENLAWGEISPRTIWHRVKGRGLDEGKDGTHFLKELAWRDFAYHLMYHSPAFLNQNWRAEWNAFPWHEDPASTAVLHWKQGRTGEPVIDAAMRQMYVTGTMHNRARMLVASYLTKHLMTHWRVGQHWFADCLIDWDPASNALGWQWTAGSGPDAAPFFRVFNPATQAEKFDPDGLYRRTYLAEWAGAEAGAPARAFFDACPRSWGLDPSIPYPQAPLVDLRAGRERALGAYKSHVKRAD